MKFKSPAPSPPSSSSSLFSSESCMVPGNVLAASCVGCWIAHDPAHSDWVLGVDPFDRAELGLGPDDSVPDISIDPDEGLVTLTNAEPAASKVFYVSVNRAGRGANGRLLPMGDSLTETGRPERWLTLIVTVPPNTLVDCCELINEDNEAQGFADVTVESHVKLQRDRHPQPTVAAGTSVPGLPVFPFPLDLHVAGGAGAAGGGPVTVDCCCSQGFGGHLTHFYAQTLYAVDLQCPVGTPVLSVGNGTVVDVRDSNQASGICVRNLWHWNSVSVELDDGQGVVDYVHIQPGSLLVATGDRVSQGQPLCRTGDVGFCPRPHLHIQVQQTAGNNEPTIPFQLLHPTTGRPFVPVAGQTF